MKKKRILAVLLSSAIAFSGMPGNVYAEEEIMLEDGFSDGETVDMVEEPTEEVGDTVLEENQSEDSNGFTDSEIETFTDENTAEDETAPETQLFSDDGETLSDVVDTGKCGNNLTYTITGDETNGYTLTISGTGEMYDYSWNKYAPWKSKNIIDIIINSGVTTIGEYAFNKCTNLKNIVIPEGIISIGGNAFDTCNKLENVVIPESVVKIRPYAFIDCKNLTNIIIPENVTKIEDGVFCGCLNMNDITIPKNVKYISNIAFLGCGLKVVKYTGTSEEWDAIGVIEKELCKAKVYYNYDPNHTHIYEEQITRAATCTQAGEKTETCKFCGDALIKEIPATGHTIVINPAVEATCTQPGKTEGSYCSTCGEVIQEQKSIPALGHIWDEGKVTKEPTCTKNGEKTYTCTRCGESKVEEIPKVEHNIVTDTAVDPSCTQSGKTEGSHCSVCGKVIRQQEIVPATGKHTWDEGKTIKAATCVTNGEILYTCTICGTTKTEKIKALGHKKATDFSIPSTCTQKGKTEGSHCSICGEVIVPQKDTTLADHNWGEWKIIQEATATSEGLRQRICKNCGGRDDELIPTPTPAPTNPSTITVTKGKTTSVKPDSSWKNVKYSTSNKKVATVDKKGKVKAVAAGTVKITVKSGSQKAVYTIVVPGTTAIKGVKSSVSVKKGKSYTLKPKLSYTESPDKVTYKSSNKKIATVSKKGVIKGKKKGTATITIKSGKVIKKCKIKVK